MADEWGDAPANDTNGWGDSNGGGVKSDGGRTFSGGRGFKPAARTDDDGGWGDSNSKTTSYKETSGWGDDAGGDGEFNGGRGRGRGGRGGGRGRGGRGGYNNDRGNDDWGSSNGGGGGGDSWGDNNGGEDGGDGGFGGGRGRGRGRGGRGGRGRGDGEDGGFRPRGGGRGGGFSNGGGDGDGFGDGGDAGEERKPVEHYVPEEKETVEDLFSSGISSGINFMKLSEVQVNVSGDDVPDPITSFETSELRPLLVENVVQSGYRTPTPIQKYSIPIILKGRDLMGCAQTGSGKTAAFLLPIINYLMANSCPAISDENGSQPQVVIVSPTRELTSQIWGQAKKFATNTIVKVVQIYGGTSTQHQRSQVLAGCHILVATPGRLNDFVKRQAVNFGSVKFIVLDEADRMLDMGFLPTIEAMLSDPSMTATGERQTLMFSATFPEEIQHLAGKFLHNYIFIAVGIVGSASADVIQTFIEVDKFSKRQKLLEMLREGGNERTLVFVETKRTADFIAAFLSENDIKSTSIHGDRLQRERELALWDFKKGICNIMVATGVAARGLDIKDVQHVINFDLPNGVDEYVHRIGRTGRVGNSGKATSFFDASRDAAQASNFVKIIQQAGQKVPDWLSTGDYASAGQSGSGFGGRDIRGDDFGRAQNFTAQPAEQADEEW